jgi:exonuclease SbcD
MRIIHCADLHLSEKEKEYSFEVLEEILAIAKKNDAGCLLFSGDIFDSFQDAVNLRLAFREKIEFFTAHYRQANKKPPFMIMIPGNHEEHKKGKANFSKYDFGLITIVEKRPFDLLSMEDTEILALPFQKHYVNSGGYAEWKVPKKQLPFRICLAHTTVSGLTYTGPDEEEETSVLDMDFFHHFKIDYAALGHIHQPITERAGSVVLAYPGSSRIWRRGEKGCHYVNLVEGKEGLEVTPLRLSSAGEYRLYTWPLNLEGQLTDVSGETKNWQKNDWIEIRLTGLVENEQAVLKLEEELKKKYSARVRRIEIDRDSIMILTGISSQPMAKKFIKLWEQKKPKNNNEEDINTWLKAREVGLAKIKEVMEARE